MPLFTNYYKNILRRWEKIRLKNSPSQTTANPGVDENIFRNRMQQPDIVSVLFLPMGHAVWEGGRFSLKKDKEEIAQADTTISGVRFQPADPSGENLESERQCQQDVVNLVQSLTKLRKTPEFSNIVLSNEILKNPQPVSQLGTRVKFGLYVDPKFGDETNATDECHRNIMRAVRKSGFVVESPQTFDPKTGMAGLSQWASTLQLRRRKIPLWLLLLPLLLLLLFSFKDCSSPEFFGSPIKTKSFIIIMDKSSSMEPYFSTVQIEARKTLENLKSSFFSTHYANVIAYHSSATTALGGIKEVNNETGQQLLQFLDNLKAEGGTNLRSGIELAATEVVAHQKPTTLIILTDGQDSSIEPMLQDKNSILSRFQGIDIIGNTLTPRVFDVENPKPINDVETKLSEFAKAFNGQFGEVK